MPEEDSQKPLQFQYTLFNESYIAARRSKLSSPNKASDLGIQCDPDFSNHAISRANFRFPLGISRKIEIPLYHFVYSRKSLDLSRKFSVQSLPIFSNL